MNTHEKVSEVERICGHHFTDKRLITSAITHPSAVEGKPVSASYERLEFLGDSILGAIVATELFERFPGLDEGALTRLKISLVSGETLSEVSGDLRIAPLIVVGESEKGTHARGMHSALENVYESIVGALYLDAGYEDTRRFVLDTLSSHFTPELVDRLSERPINPKSRLQITQRDLRLAPEYKLVGERAPRTTPPFTSVVLDRQTSAWAGFRPLQEELRERRRRGRARAHGTGRRQGGRRQRRPR